MITTAAIMTNTTMKKRDGTTVAITRAGREREDSGMDDVGPVIRKMLGLRDRTM